MRFAILASATVILMMSCYQEPISMTEPLDPVQSCLYQLSEEYSLDLPCGSQITPWSGEADPGVGILAFADHEIFFKIGDNLFESLGSIESGQDSTLDYYTIWLNGEVRILVDERYDIPMLFIYFIDRSNGKKLTFWTESVDSEEMIVCRLLSLRG